MAELDIQQKSGTSTWWLWLIGLLLLLLIGWWIVAALWDNDDVGRVGAYNENEAFPVATAVTAPDTYRDRMVSGYARVASVISDRGFWVENDGQRLFVVMDEDANETVNVNAGQTVMLSGRVMTANTAAGLPGIQSLEQDTRQVLDTQRSFLYVDAPQGINVVNR